MSRLAKRGVSGSRLRRGLVLSALLLALVAALTAQASTPPRLRVVEVVQLAPRVVGSRSSQARGVVFMTRQRLRLVLPPGGLGTSGFEPVRSM